MSAKNGISSTIESLVPKAALTLGLVLGLLLIPLATANAEITGDPCTTCSIDASAARYSGLAEFLEAKAEASIAASAARYNGLASFFASPCMAEQLEFSDSGVAALCALGADTLAADKSVQFSDSGVHGLLAVRAAEIAAVDVPPYTSVATFDIAKAASAGVAQFNDSGVGALLALGPEALGGIGSGLYDDSGVHGLLAVRAADIADDDAPPYTGVATSREAEDAAGGLMK
jgi:hypothetical protein